jgi:hypothetical protein
MEDNNLYIRHLSQKDGGKDNKFLRGEYGSFLSKVRFFCPNKFCTPVLLTSKKG